MPKPARNSTAADISKHTRGTFRVERNQLGELMIADSQGRNLLHGDSPFPLSQRTANAELFARSPRIYDVAMRMAIELSASPAMSEKHTDLIEQAFAVLGLAD